ncbi:MAG: HEAT repeat domain-containing protein [bacterium]|nr:HEAT repeat domain-containing protein [bacterium]
METTTLKIRNLVKNANKFDDMQFRLLLEDLVKQGGREAESLLGELATTDSIPESVRANILRIMGYITSITFLMPLRKILESDENFRLRKAAIISISKYNDKRALNMLDHALKQIKNPILQESISNEISRIKKDNPILSLLPKFLNGVNDPKTFRTTLEVLKKILNPQDAQVFIYHLDSDIPFVGEGAFEVLCWRGDESVKFSIFDFFRAKLKLVDCIQEDECYSLVHLLTLLEQFILRNSDTINYVLKDLKDLYKEAGDPKVKDILINMFSSSPKREVLSFLEDIYNNEPGRRQMLIEKLEGNEGGVFILIYKYKNDEALKKELLLALLTTQAGWEYVFDIFDSLTPGYQQLVLEKITTSNYKFSRKLIERFLMSNDFGQKKLALDKIRENSDAGFQGILFNPDYENDFVRMQQEYMGAISQLFFIQTFKFIINRVVKLESPRPIMRRYLEQTDSFIMCEPVIRLGNDDDLAPLAETIVKFNNKDLNLALLDIFCSLKTFDYNTYQKFQKFLDTFKDLRGARISSEESGAVNKIRANFQYISDDIKTIEKGKTNSKHFLEKTFPDFELLEYMLKTHHLSFFINRGTFIDRIKKVFKITNDIDAFDAIKFFIRRPDFCFYFKEEIRLSSKSGNYLLKNDAEKLLKTMPTDLRFVLIFKKTAYYSCFEDQFNEIITEFEVVHNQELTASDILITDTESFKSLAADNQLNTENRYVLLADKEEFQDIKDLNPKVFPPPLSFYKIVKAIIEDLFPA